MFFILLLLTGLPTRIISLFLFNKNEWYFFSFGMNGLFFKKTYVESI